MSQTLAVPSRFKRAASRSMKRLPVAPASARESAATRTLRFTPAEMRLIRKLRREIQTGFDELEVVLNDIKKILS